MNITTNRFRIVIKWYPDPAMNAQNRRDAIWWVLAFITGYAAVRWG